MTRLWLIGSIGLLTGTLSVLLPGCGGSAGSSFGGQISDGGNSNSIVPGDDDERDDGDEDDDEGGVPGGGSTGGGSTGGGSTGGGSAGGGSTGGGSTGGGSTGGGSTGGGSTGGGSTGGGSTALSFATSVQPLAQASCSCHGTTMTTRATILARGYVVAGSPGTSPYLATGSGGNGHPGGNRWGANATTVQQWIQDGAQP